MGKNSGIPIYDVQECEYIASHRIANNFDNKKRVNKFRVGANSETCFFSW